MKDDDLKNVMPSYMKGINDSLTRGNFSSAQGVGATLRASGKDALSRAVSPVTGVVKAVHNNVTPVVQGLTRGIVTGDPGGDLSQAERPGKPYGINASDAKMAPSLLDAERGNAEPAMPKNDDPIARDYLRENSRAANGDLNAGRTEAVPGLDGVNYAGRYGNTDVFAGKGASGETAFSDTANLATTRGGQAAAVPYGKTAVTNTSPAALGPVDLNRDGLPDQTSPELQEARQAAVDRGDYSAVDRSYMTSEQRSQQDKMRKQEELRDAAYRADPLNAYAVDQDSLASGRNQMLEAEQMEYDRGQDKLKRQDNQASTAFERNKAIAKIITDIESATGFPMKEGEDGEQVPMTIEEKRQYAERILGGNLNDVSRGAGGQTDDETAKIINSFL